MALTIAGRDTLSAKRLSEFSASLGLPVAVSDKVVADLLARTVSLGDQLLNSALPFDRRTLDKVARQVAARRTSLEP